MLQFLQNLIERHICNLEDHQQMIKQISAFGDHVCTVAFNGSNDRFHGFFTELLAARVCPLATRLAV